MRGTFFLGLAEEECWSEETLLLLLLLRIDDREGVQLHEGPTAVLVMSTLAELTPKCARSSLAFPSWQMDLTLVGHTGLLDMGYLFSLLLLLLLLSPSSWFTREMRPFFFSSLLLFCCLFFKLFSSCFTLFLRSQLYGRFSLVLPMVNEVQGNKMGALVMFTTDIFLFSMFPTAPTT